MNITEEKEICPNCDKEHTNDEWNGYCSKICWWGFPIDS